MTIKDAILQFVPLNFLTKWKAPGPFIFFVHGIGIDKPYINNVYPSHSAESFSTMLDRLLIHFEPLFDLSKDAILNARRNQMIATFDDGLRSTYELAAPILEKKGIPAIFFINPSFVDNKEIFYRFEASLIIEALKSATPRQKSTITSLLNGAKGNNSDLSDSILAVEYPNRKIYKEIAAALNLDMVGFFRNETPFMSEDQIIDLQRRGFYIGAHSMSHPRYSEVTEEEQVYQTITSLKYVHEQFKPGYRYFAFPFNNRGVNDTFYAKVETEVDLFFTTSGWQPKLSSTALIHRTGLDAIENPVPFLKRILL